MQPERKIEKLLRAYAKKRKADASGAFTLNPATRRRLQSEVDKQFTEPPEEESVSLWQLFRQQWALLAGFALMIFFMATMFLPTLSKAKMKSHSVSAMSNLKQIGVAAQIAAVDNSGRLPATLDELTNNQLLSENILTDPMSGKRFVFAAGGEKLDALASNAVLAYSPEDKKGRAVLLADGSVQMMSRQQFDDLDQRALKAPAAPTEIPSTRREIAVASRSGDALSSDREVPAAASVASGEALALNGASGSAGSGSGNNFTSEKKDFYAATAIPAAAQAKQLFKDVERAKSEDLRLNSNSQKFRNAVANNAPVLVSFELQQNGNNLAVVDADGSVYQGSLQTNSPVSETPAPVVEPPTAQNTQNQISTVAEDQNVAENNFYFRVAGQNRTSKQNVVFTGNLIPLAGSQYNSQAAATAENSAGVGGMSQVQNAAVFSNSRIAGTATVDVTNQIEINALPALP
jgi:hypothetical protein